MSDKKLLIKALLIGTLCGLLFAVILTCILSIVILSSGLLPEGIIQYAMAVILGFGAFSGGFVASKLTNSAGLVVGALTGAIIFILVLAISLSNNDSPLSMLTLVKLLLCLFLGSGGGVAGLHKREKISIK